MGASQSLPSFIFPEMSESDLKSFVSSLNSAKLDLKYERTLGKGRVSWSMLVRKSDGLLLMRLYAKRSNGKMTGRRRTSSISTNVDPLAATKLSFIHELYYEKCSQFDFVLKPILINDSDEFLVMIRPFARFNLPDRLISESLGWEDKIWIAEQLIESFIKLHALRAFHGDFGSGKVFLTSQNKVMIGDFAPIKPFGLQSKQQSPIEFYQIWFDEGLDGEANEIGKGCYLAPERLKFNQIESFEAADLFSFGCVLAELFSSRGFLQFKDTLKLSKASSDCVLNDLVDNCDIANIEIVNLIKRLCVRDPKERSLTLKDLEMIKSLADPKIKNWRVALDKYKSSESFYTKKQVISEFPSEICDYENILLMIFKEKDQILSSLLVKYLLDHSENQVQEQVLFEALKENQFVQSVIYEYLTVDNLKCSVSGKQFDLIQAFNSGNRDVLFQQITKEPDLKDVLYALESRKLPVDKVKGILNKVLQIYRARDVKDADFEDLLLFEYLKIEADEEEIDNLYKTFKISYDSLVPASLSRIAFQLDLEKNKVPIIKTGTEVKKTNAPITKLSFDFPRFKQRLIMKFRISDDIIGTLQSPDKGFFICYSTTTLFFWDFKALLRVGNKVPVTDPIASVNPRSEAVISSIIYSDDPDTILISFKDGIIGLYRVNFKNGNIEFSIRESFGPFNSDNVLLMSRCKRGRVLLVIEKFNIYGISAEGGEVLFEIKVEEYEIISVVDLIEGCLLCIDSKGNFRFIEVFYETGQVLATWHLNLSSDTQWILENVTVHKLSGKFNLIVKIKNEQLGRAILVYSIDPQSEIVTCTFRHWIINDYNDKNLPFINCVCGDSGKDQVLSVQIENCNLLGFEEEIVEISDGILRLIDYNCISSMNTTSMLYPLTYKPSLKLRNKRSSVPEIVEKSGGDLLEESYSKNIIGKLITFDDKNIIIAAIIDKTILLYC